MKLSRFLQQNPIFRSSMVLIVITVFVKLFGYGEKLVLAYYWGTGSEVDIYSLVTTILLSLFFLFREVIEPGYLKVFQEIESRSRKLSKGFFNLAFLIIAAITLLITIIFLLYPNQVISLFAPGFKDHSQDTAAKLIQIAGPATIFLVLSTLTYITLNAYKEFAIAAMGDLLQKATILITIVIFYSKLGIYALAVGIIAGAFARLITHFPVLLRSISSGFHLCTEKEPVKRIWQLTWPLLVGVLFSQSSMLIDNIFASYLQEGSISALSYSKKLVDLPILLLPYALSVVVFPYLSQFAINGEIDRMKKLLYQSLKWITIIFLPLSIFCVLFSSPLIEIVYQRGAFNDYSTQLTARPFLIYSTALLVFALETIVVIYFFSTGNTKTPIFTGIICSIINILLTYSLISIAGYLGIAISLAVSKTIKLGILLFILYQKGHLAIKKPHQTYIRFFCATFLFLLILFVLREYGSGLIDGSSKVIQLIYISLFVLIAIIPYAITIFYPNRDQLFERIQFVKKSANNKT